MNSPANGSRGNNGHFYSSSSVMHFSNTGGGNQPQVYHATSSVTSGPGGVSFLSYLQLLGMYLGMYSLGFIQDCFCGE